MKIPVLSYNELKRRDLDLLLEEDEDAEIVWINSVPYTVEYI